MRSRDLRHTDMALTIERFVLNLEKSKLVDPAQLCLIRAEIDEGSDRDAASLAAVLRSRGVLTTWQVEKLLAGVDRGFCLGHYKLLRLVASSGMSSVYEAEHRHLHRRAALKILPSRLVGDGSLLERFYREARAVSRLDHPNIVRGFDVGFEDGHHYFVMEFVEGSSLQELVESSGPRPPEEAARLIRQAALGLEHAHRAGLVHRDIKPANLIRDLEGTVKILDLGLVRSLDPKDDGEASLTRAHGEGVLGTVDYLSPEQAINSHDVDIRSDIYSLGCTLYFLLAGVPPFSRGTLAERLLAHQTQTPPGLAYVRPEIPAGLIRIVLRMLSKRPEERYQCPDDVSAALADWLGGRGASPAVPAPKFITAGQRSLAKVQAKACHSTWRAGQAAPISAAAVTASRPARSPGKSIETRTPSRPLQECWERWMLVVRALGPRGCSRRKLNEASYGLIYQELRQTCRASYAEVDEPTRLMLSRIEDLISPWPTLRSLRVVLRGELGAGLLLQVMEIDRLIGSRPTPSISVLTFALLLAAGVIVALILSSLS
jgi:serine/threonine protein kinase